MGSGPSVPSGVTWHLDAYETLRHESLFTPPEVYCLMRRFCRLLGRDSCTLSDSVTADKLRTMPEFRNHPLRDRIIYTFSAPSTGDAKSAVIKRPTVAALLRAPMTLPQRTVTCLDYLRLLAAFHSRATFDLKATAAFRIYDFTGDDYITALDIRTLFSFLFGANVLPHELDSVAAHLLGEVDADENGELTVEEFKRILRRLPEFMTNFTVDIEFGNVAVEA